MSAIPASGRSSVSKFRSWSLRPFLERSFWVTVCKNGSAYPIGPLSVCPVLSVCLSVPLVYCDQTVGWITMPLGTEVGLGPGHIVLDVR